MKANSTGALSGCLIWVLTFGVLSSCLCPFAAGLGGFMSAVRGEWAAQVVGPLLCPEGSTPSIRSYESTSIDEFGNPENATGYDLICTSPQGAETNLGGAYALVILGGFVLGGLALAAVLALALAAPAGVLFARLLKRNQSEAER